MQGYEVKFKIYAESQEDADQVSQSLKDFVESQRVQGRAVTSEKIKNAMDNLWRNPFIKAQVNNYFK